MYKISLAKEEDIQDIMLYIKNEWRETHILANNREFFIYEFLEKDNINFLFANDNENKIQGILGFIKSNNTLKPDIWPTIWKVSKNLKDPMLGIKLFNFIRNELPHRGFLGIGANEVSLPLYKFLKIPTYILNQFYILNDSIKDYKIANIKNFKANSFSSKNEQRELILIDDLKFLKNNFNFEKYQNNIPYKDYEYIKKRYFNYPIFKYNVYGIKDFNSSEIYSLIITRNISHNSSQIIRIVDYIGNEIDISYISKHLYNLIINNEYEYIDFLNYGIDEDLLIESGFKKLNYSNDEVIIPQYFSPFLRENKKIYFFADTKEIKFTVCKADGDQDRPNI